MFTFTKTFLAVSAIAAVLPTSLAQTAGNATQAQLEQRMISACQSSIETPNFNWAYEFDPNDNSGFTQLYTYDYSLCQNVPVLSARLTNYGTDGSFVSCTFSQFTSEGRFTSVCSRTRGDMATQAGVEGQDFSTQLRIGIRPTFSLREDIFTVYALDTSTSMASSTSATATATSPATTTSAPATVSELSRRQRRAVETGEAVLNADMICEAGHTACPMRDRKRWFNRCIDTSSELYACGGCPGAPGTQDCSELKGVADVQCVQGTCQIKRCDRSHKLSSDGKTCVRKEVIKKRSVW